jgi:crotonobetainyl-CoA:carnitine CoA-transferase CaiB-like acyl-CoA transferase
VGQPVTLARTPSRMSHAAPEPGDATEELLRGLGFGAEEIDTLRRKLVV